MSKWCYNYDSGEYEDIDKDGFSWSQGEFVYNWDDSEYRREEEEDAKRLWEDDDDWQITNHIKSIIKRMIPVKCEECTKAEF